MKRKPASEHRAFLLRASPHGEADVIATLLSDREGVLGAIARNARTQSPKRAVLLEPFHTLRIALVPGSGELWSLRSASIDVARTAVLADAARLEACGLAVRWCRMLSPAHVPEPEVFASLERTLDALEAHRDVDATLAAFGLTLLEVLGYGLVLDGCARCAKPRPAGRAAIVDAAVGGVLCETCRKGHGNVDAALPGVFLDALASDPEATLASSPHAAHVLAIVRAAIDARARAMGHRGDRA